MRATNLQFILHTKEPVYSLDFHPFDSNRFATCGGDNAVRLWKIVKRGTEIFPIESDQPLKQKGKSKDSQVIDFNVAPHSEEEQFTEGPLTIEYIATLDNHNAPVNVVRFSPNGDILASAGDDGALVLWKKKEDVIGEDGKPIVSDNPISNFSLGQGVDEFCLERWKAVTVLRGSLSDIYDMAWSPCGRFIITGSVDSTARVWDVITNRCLAIINEHRLYIQGVAWDPRGEYLITQSSDRTVKIHSFNFKPSSGAFYTKTIASHGRQAIAKSGEMEDDPTKTADPAKSTLTFNYLYQSETLASFFRRPDITPDGSLVITPAGICKDADSGEITYCVHIFPRNEVTSPPLIRLNGFPKPPITIRCSPIIYKLGSGPDSAFSLPYRCVFAVATQDSVFVFNTQHSHPIAFVTNLHHASLTDLSWSSDGQTLLVSSADGFASILKFSPEELGTPTPKPLPVEALQPTVDQVVITETSKTPTEPASQLVQPNILIPRPKKSVLEMMRSATPTAEIAPTPIQTNSQNIPPSMLQNTIVLPQSSTANTPTKKRRIVPTFVSNLN